MTDSKAMSNDTVRAAADWLIGGGELGELIRSTDWSGTPFGPRESWPGTLRTIVSLIVGSDFPMALLWGRELVFLYNDAYRHIAGDRHPGALGRSTRDVWPEVWNINAPIFAAVMDRGETVSLEDKLFPIVRHGRRENAYFTLCYSPVRAEDGTVLGTLVTLLETTERVHQHREQQERLRVAFENVALGIAELGLDGRIQNVNGRFGSLLGYEPHELVGKSIHELTAPEDRDRSRELNSRVLGGELDRFEYEKRYLKKDGTPLWVRVTVSAVRDTSGAVLRAIGTVEDITERKQVEEELDRERSLLQAVFDNIPVLLVRWDPRLNRFALNRTAEAVLGWSTAEANAGDLMSMVYPDPDYRARVGAYMQSLEQGFREWIVTTKGGDSIPIEWANVRLRDDTSIGIGVDVRQRKQAEEALRQALAKAQAGDRMLAALMGNLPEGITICDADGNLQMVSQHGQALLGGPHAGMTIEEVVMDWAVYRPDSRDVMPVEELPLARALKGETVQDFELVQVNSQGRELPLLCNAAPIRDESGQVIGAIVAWRDMTERRRAEAALRQSEERFRTLADSMPQLVWTATPDGTVEYINRRHGDLYGARLNADGAWEWSPAIHPEDLPETLAAWERAVRTGQAYEAEQRVRMADGTYRWHLARATPVLDGSGCVVKWYGTTTDIHQQKEAAQALREADSRKNEFLAMLSHELRNPLAPIKNSLHVLDRATPGGQQARRAQQVIDRQVQHMTRLIDDLLDVTRISRGKIQLHRERMELCDLVRRTIEDHRSLFNTAGVDLRVETCDGPLHVEGDPTRLAQAIGNLLGNAVKFTPRGGWVSLRLDSGNGRASVHVRDNGAGMESGLLHKLFEPFVQAEATLDRSKGGLGLGLALVKALVELHGGTVSAQSDGVGKGAEFTLTLPLELEASTGSPGSGSSRSSKPSRRSLRVLLIEDNDDAAQSLKEALELNGHEVAIAADGLEGIEKARSFTPDVVLCDIGLPGIDGFEVARRMRADPSLARACLVALSGYAGPEDIARSQEAGFLRHLAKPLDIATLQDTITQACSSSGRVEGENP